MKLKTRLLTPLFAVLMLGTATSAFADLNCTVTTTPVPRAINNGHWENTGDLTFTCSAANTVPTTDTSVTIFYSGLPITNTTTLPTDHNIKVTSAGSVTAALDTTRADTGSTGVNQASSLVAVLIPAVTAPVVGPIVTFTVSNVLLSLNGGTTIGGSVSANINLVSASGNSVLTGSPIVIISNVLPMLNSTTQPPVLLAPIVGEAAGPAQFTSAGGIPPANVACSTTNCRNAKAAFSMTITEDHIDSWRSPAIFYDNGVGVSGTGTTIPTSGTSILFTFSGMLPGSIISNCVLAVPAGQAWALTGSGIAGTNGQTTLVAEPTVVPLSSKTTLDTLTLNCGTSTANPAYLPGTSSGAATTAITVDMRPALVATSNVPAAPATNALTGGTPRYQSTGGVVGPVTVVQFGASAVGQTTMLIPYALANVGTFDTGIAIANTTKDPVFGTDAQGAAPDTSGSVSFNFFPGDGSANFTITPTTGFNLVNGQIPAGNSFIGTLSAILKSANNTSPFQGYIIAVTNFTHAHGTAYVYGGGAADRLTSATDVLVISNPLGVARSAFGPLTGVEPTAK